MFLYRALLWPAPGKLPALRDAVVGAVRSGERVIVAERLLGEAAMLSVSRRFDSLAAFMEWRRSFTPNPATAEHFGRTPSSELWEIVRPVEFAADTRLLARATYQPAAGKGPEARRLLERFVDDNQSRGRPAGMSIGVSGGPAMIAIVRQFQDPAGLERTRAEIIADPANQALGEKLGPLLVGPPHTPEIMAILHNGM